MDLSVLEIDDVQELGFDLSSPNILEANKTIPPVAIPTLVRSNPISPVAVKSNPIKMNVIESSQIQNQPPLQQKIPHVYAKHTRYPMQVKEPPITYGDIMTKMGLFVVNGELHLLKDGKNAQQPKGVNIEQDPRQHSYIHNKYFSKLPEPVHEPQVPRSPAELRDMLIRDIVQKHRIKHIKSTKMPLIRGGGNYMSNVVPGDMNKLFAFSHSK